MDKERFQDDFPQFPSTYWRDTEDIHSFPRLNQHVEADVAIVGGGITGLTTAYLLKDSGLKIVLVDAGKLIDGTTGYTTAKVTAQHGLVYNYIKSHFDLETAKNYYEFNNQAMKLIDEIIYNENIDCDYSIEDAVIYSTSKSNAKKLDKEKETYDEIGIPNEYKEEIPLEIEVEKALYMKSQAQFHPVKYLNKIIESLVEAGVDIYENTVAKGVQNGEKPVVKLREGGSITCKHVVDAAHFPFTDFRGIFSARLYPERSYIIASKSVKPYPGGMYASIDSPTRSIRATPYEGEDLWLIGGEGHKTGKGGDTYEKYLSLKGFAYDAFGLSNFQYRWSAQDMTSLDSMPYIGSLSDKQSNIYVATGYRKWGMTLGTGAARLIADLILGEPNPYQKMFAPDRFHADPDLAHFAEINAEAMKELVKGKLEFTKSSIDEMHKDHGEVIRINGQRAGVYKDLSGNVQIVDTTCTHMGCELNWNQGERTWDCPCHGSRFSTKGDVLEGPAKSPLKKLEDK